MYSVFSVLLLLWPLCIPAAPAPVLAPAPGRQTGLRNANDIYTVEVRGDKYLVYSPYFKRKEEAVTELVIPTEAGQDDQIIVLEAYNAEERARADGSPRLHLSEVVENVARNHARKPLSSINWLVIDGVINRPTVEVVKRYKSDWQTLHPGDKFPARVTVTSSDPSWPAFGATPFFKTANYLFKDDRKAVRSIDIAQKWNGNNLWFRMG
ncbi:hypothetical protein LX32DRAFT_681681 [Colletotrichum zoysiae]|uniref:Uncharacterized protein n=1 Tax=Colletotrichum zoysiae TaxID=1216348 RepID=A0AAD9M1G5_9PEZI|nr:hypothetical protein LX32DRAFT_681681 [Colletotrichum zoysiae]